jgi:hypothetical protein
MYLWGCASWDQLAIHPESYGTNGSSYRERGVVALVGAHNAAVNKALALAPATRTPSSAPAATIKLLALPPASLTTRPPSPPRIKPEVAGLELPPDSPQVQAGLVKPPASRPPPRAVAALEDSLAKESGKVATNATNANAATGKITVSNSTASISTASTSAAPPLPRKNAAAACMCSVLAMLVAMLLPLLQPLLL